MMLNITKPFVSFDCKVEVAAKSEATCGAVLKSAASSLPSSLSGPVNKICKLVKKCWHITCTFNFPFWLSQSDTILSLPTSMPKTFRKYKTKE